MIGNGDGDAICQHFESLIEHNFTILSKQKFSRPINTIKVLIKVLEIFKKKAKIEKEKSTSKN